MVYGIYNTILKFDTFVSFLGAFEVIMENMYRKERS